jgi:hypothetical protein
LWYKIILALPGDEDISVCFRCWRKRFRPISADVKFFVVEPFDASMPPLKDSSKTFQKWSSRCKANKMLQDGLKNGSIDPSMKPKEVWESSIEYQKYSLAAFRSAFNRKKTEMGVHLRDEGEFRKKPGPLLAHVLLLFLCLTHAPCLSLLDCFVLFLFTFEIWRRQI